MAIDPRLLDSACQANIDENFNRTLGIVGDTLPAIATGDAGKVLTVNDDEDGVEWASGGGGGGGGGGASVLVVTVTESNGTYTCDKTANEIWEAGAFVLSYPMSGANIKTPGSIVNQGASGYLVLDGYQFRENNMSAADGGSYPSATVGGNS